MPLARSVVGVVQGSPGLLALLHRQFQGLQLERDACLASNYALAKENLALRPRLEMGRTALAIKYQELREVAENCADKLQRLGEGWPRRTAWGGARFLRVGLGHTYSWTKSDGSWFGPSGE